MTVRNCWWALYRVVHHTFNFCSRPMVTGTSVLGVTFGDGVMLAADTLGRFKHRYSPWFEIVFSEYM